MSGVLFFLSLVLGGTSVALLLPALVGATLGDGHAVDFLIVAGLGGFVAAALRLALLGRVQQVRRVQGYWLLILSWVLLSGFAALPFGPVVHWSVSDLLFESVSALTTTGATIFPTLEELPPSLIFWRAELQWLGGFLTLLSVILILAPAGIGGLPDRQIRLIEHADRSEGAQMRSAVGEIALIYCAATLACVVALILSGLPIFDAVCLAFSTLSTGGFFPRDGGIAVYGRPFAEFVLMFFMLVGATSVIWHRMVFQRRNQLLREHRESYFIIGSAIVVGMIMAFTAIGGLRGAGGAVDALTLLREGLFTGISLVTTTGFEGGSVGFTVLPLTFVVFLAFIGGGTFSTAGGLKQYRFGGMCVQAYRDLVRLVYPHGIRPAYFGSQAYDIQLMKSIWSFFAIAIFAVFLGANLIALEPIRFEGALLASVAALSNIGPLYNPAWVDTIGTIPAYSEMSGQTKAVLMALMLLGRIEILALFGALNRTYWLRR